MSNTVKSNLFVEFTLTNNCNCACKYCFEGNHTCETRNLDVEKRQLELLINACDTFDKSKYDKFTISFWGGEPFLNTEFMYKIITSTYGYDFVQYHCYTNGTLVNKFKELINLPFFKFIKNRFHVQLSYDGEPHHTIMRGNTANSVLETAKLLQNNGVIFSFKATLSYDLIDKLPEIWDSYKQLYDIFGNKVSYFPTLDTSTTPPADAFDKWKNATLTVLKKEFKFICSHGRPLWTWFSENRKMNCALNNSVHIHNDGNIYICHGCPYLKNKDKFKKSNIFDIQSLYDVITTDFSMSLGDVCTKCEATHCSTCHVTQIKDNEDIYENWTSCRANDKNKCKYYKWFGYISKLLKYCILKNNYIKI